MIQDRFNVSAPVGKNAEVVITQITSCSFFLFFSLLTRIFKFFRGKGEGVGLQGRIVQEGSNVQKMQFFENFASPARYEPAHEPTLATKKINSVNLKTRATCPSKSNARVQWRSCLR